MPSLSRKCKYHCQSLPTQYIRTRIYIYIYRFIVSSKLVGNLVCIIDHSVETIRWRRIVGKEKKGTCSAIDIIGPPNDSYRRIYTLFVYQTRQLEQWNYSDSASIFGSGITSHVSQITKPFTLLYLSLFPSKKYFSSLFRNRESCIIAIVISSFSPRNQRESRILSRSVVVKFA